MNDFNFFEPYLENTKKDHKKLLCYASAIVLIVIFLTIPFVNILYIEKIEKQAITVSNMANTPETYEERTDIEQKSQKIEQMKADIQKLKNLDSEMKKKDIINDFLIYTLRDMVPKDMFFDRVGVHPEKVEIQGIAKNKLAIAEFKYNLENIVDFQDIFISNISGDEGKYNFTLTFKIKDVSQR